MVSVYFESQTGVQSELVAQFNDEELYNECLSVLERVAGYNNMIVTESLEEIEIKEVYEN